MLNNITIKKKMLLFILGLAALIYIITIGFISYNLRNNAVQEAKLLADTYALQKANHIKAKLEEDMAITRAMAFIMQDYIDLPTAQREEMQNRLMHNIIEEYPRYEAVWMSWQLQYIDSTWFKEYGRLSINCYWDNGEIKSSQEKKELDGFVRDGLYYRLYTDQKELLTEPYEFDSYDLNSDEMLLAVSPTAPLLKDGKTLGVIGIDMSLEDYTDMTDIDAFETGYAFLLSFDGTIVAHPDNALTNLPIDTLSFTKGIDVDFKELIKNGESQSFTIYDEAIADDVYVSFTSIPVGRSDKPWSVGIIIPYSEITKTFNTTFMLTLIVGIIGLAILSFVILKIANGITDSLDETNKLLKDLSNGHLETEIKLDINSQDELGDMSRSVASLQKELSSKAEFAQQIGEGNLDVEFTASSEDDVLGNSLINMRNSLNKTQLEEKHRRWTTEGLAKFSEVLQSNTGDMDEFCSSIISNLVKYLHAIQGGMFLINDDDEADKHIELKGAYAYERRKFLNKRIEMGEGLVGQCILEKKSIILKEVPNNYVNVTSGLGKSNPNCIILIPLLLNEEVFGVVELVSFDEYQQHEIEFVEKLAENIASTVSSVKINQKTRSLLEQSQIQAEELRAQEEEMRQNMEELQATQEEMGRKEREYIERINELESEAADKS